MHLTQTGRGFSGTDGGVGGGVVSVIVGVSIKGAGRKAIRSVNGEARFVYKGWVSLVLGRDYLFFGSALVLHIGSGEFGRWIRTS